MVWGDVSGAGDITARWDDVRAAWVTSERGVRWHQSTAG